MQPDDRELRRIAGGNFDGGQERFGRARHRSFYLLHICAYSLLYAQFYPRPAAEMPASREQNERRQAIARLLEQHSIDRQAKLVELLQAEGYPATQSSVSRD